MVETRQGIFACLVSLLFQGAAGNCLTNGICCTVCRNGGQVLNPGHSFQMSDPDNTYTWTCGGLEEALADVNILGAPGENFYCELARLWVDRECECSGDPAPPPNNVVDPNPACDLCGAVGGTQRELNFVPELLADELVETGVAGRMPCGGLYHALSEGILPANVCPIVQGNAGGACCSIPDLEPPNFNPPPTPAPVNQCGGLGEECENTSCCGNLICRARGINIAKICSGRPRASRQSVARRGAGGAAGRAKFAN